MRVLLILLFSLTSYAEAIACQMNQFALSDIQRADVVIKAEFVSYERHATGLTPHAIIRARTLETLKGDERETWGFYWPYTYPDSWSYGDVFFIAGSSGMFPGSVLGDDWKTKMKDDSKLIFVFEPICAGPFVFRTTLSDDQRWTIRRSVMDSQNSIPLLSDERETPTLAEANLIAEIEEARAADIKAKIQQIRIHLKPFAKPRQGDR